MEIGTHMALRWHEDGKPGEVEHYILAFPVEGGPSSVVSPVSKVGALLRGLTGAGSRIRYESNEDRLGRVRVIELEVVAVWPPLTSTLDSAA